MAVSGTTSFSMKLGDVIDKAFRRIGKGSEGEAITARMYEDGKTSLNLILKSKLGTSDKMFLRTEASLVLVSGQEGYTLDDPFPLRFLSVRRVDSDGREIPMNELSRQEYFDLPNKTTSPSVPVSWYFDPQSDAGVLYVWPSPDSNSATEYSLNVTWLRRIDDMTSTSDDLDMPQEWLDPVIWMLADDLEVEYPCNDTRLAMKVSAKAAEGKAILTNWETELASVYVQPDTGY